MIGARIMLEDDTEVCSVYLRCSPRVGEYIWVADQDVIDRHGSSSFIVNEVAHWVSTKWTPNTHTGDPVHTLAIYVKPTRQDDVNSG